MFNNKNMNLFVYLLNFDRGCVLKSIEYFLRILFQIQLSAASEFTDFFVPMDFDPIVLPVFPGNIILCIYLVYGFFVFLVVIQEQLIGT